jgi:hypothetical protein
MTRQNTLLLAIAALVVAGLAFLSLGKGDGPAKEAVAPAPTVSIECEDGPCKVGSKLTIAVEGVKQHLKLNAHAEAGDQKVRLFGNATVSKSDDRMVLPYNVELSGELKDAPQWTVHFVFTSLQNEPVADVSVPLSVTN